MFAYKSSSDSNCRPSEFSLVVFYFFLMEYVVMSDRVGVYPLLKKLECYMCITLEYKNYFRNNTRGSMIFTNSLTPKKWKKYVYKKLFRNDCFLFLLQVFYIVLDIESTQWHKALTKHTNTIVGLYKHSLFLRLVSLPLLYT